MVAQASNKKWNWARWLLPDVKSLFLEKSFVFVCRFIEGSALETCNLDIFTMLGGTRCD